MVKKLPCLYAYIHETKEGNRNENLFRALTHLRHYNKNTSIDDMVNEALIINNEFETPLPKTEVEIILQHTLKKNYRTSCWKFKKYCKQCRYGKFHKLFRNSKPNYWKHINNSNRLTGIKLLEDDTYYPWDILDTSKLSEGDRLVVQHFREQMSIPINIDTIVKAYGIPVGDKAKREWMKFKGL